MGKILFTLSTAISKNPNKVPALDSYKTMKGLNTVESLSAGAA